MFMAFIVFALTVLYVLLLFLYKYGWFLQKEFVVKDNFEPNTSFSVIVAARNESANIEKCISSVLSQNYPQHLFELIIVDDCSTDNTVDIVSSINAPNLKLIKLGDFLTDNETVVSYKKKALSTGILHSNGSLVVTTDADCWMDDCWLLSLAAYYEEFNPEMIVAPVKFYTKSSLLHSFQSLDFMTMQGITTAIVRLNLGVMCNGANLAFSRKAFEVVGGYDGVDHLVSGDDYLLQLKIRNTFPGTIKYLKSSQAIVTTLPQPTWTEFFQQRIRWASKSGRYKDSKMTVMLLLVYIFNCSIFLLALMSIVNSQWISVLTQVFVLKTAAELFFLLPVAKFYGNLRQLIIFPFLQPLHIVYIIVAGFLSRIGKFEWKSRSSIQH
jgi:glycosyltransferase involved in cell wall biosynthesis